MLKILLLQQYYFPEMTGGARRAKELSEEFVINGHKVTVFTTYPREFRSMPGYDVKRTEVLNRVTIIRSNTIFNVGKNPIIRMLSYFMYVIHSFIYISKNRNNYDILISMAPLPSAIAPALANRMYKIPHHFDIPDILPDLGIVAGMINNKFLINFLYKIEKWVYNNSDSISTCTRGQLGNINSKGISINKLKWIPDWIDTEFHYSNLKLYKEDISNIIKYPGKKIISFIGNIGALQNPEIFLDIMISLSEQGHNDILFLFVGDGIMLPHIKKIKEEKNIDNVKILGRMKREYIPAIMDISDVLVANYVSDEHLDLYIPGKTFEYAISNTPIVIGARGDAKNLIKKYKLGIVTPPSDKNSFIESILYVLGNSFDYKPKIDLFRKQYSIKNVVKLYDSILEKYLKKE